MRPAILSSALFATLPLISLAGCPAVNDPGDDDSSAGDDDDSTPPPEFAFWSSAFDQDGDLPEEYECFNGNPEIFWEGVPAGTVSLALIFDDPTAGDFPHWAIYNMAPDSTGIPEDASGGDASGELPDGSEELVNGFGDEGYLGSCPCGPGQNHYRWRLWALDAELDDPDGGSADSQFGDLADQADDHEIESLEMNHFYGPATICR